MERLPSLDVKARPAKGLGQLKAYVFWLYNFQHGTFAMLLNMDAPQPRLRGESRLPPCGSAPPA